MKLIKCPKCGEMYSDSYKTCTKVDRKSVV